MNILNELSLLTLNDKRYQERKEKKHLFKRKGEKMKTNKRYCIRQKLTENFTQILVLVHLELSATILLGTPSAAN